MNNLKRKLRGKNPFIISKKIKYLKLNIIEEVKDLYTEEYKPLLREILQDLIKWKESHAHGWDNLIL